MGCPEVLDITDFLYVIGRSCLIWGCDTLIKQGLVHGLEALLCPIFLWLLALRIKQANAKSPKLGLINDQVEVQVLHDFSLSRKKRILVASQQGLLSAIIISPAKTRKNILSTSCNTLSH